MSYSASKDVKELIEYHGLKHTIEAFCNYLYDNIKEPEQYRIENMILGLKQIASIRRILLKEVRRINETTKEG